MIELETEFLVLEVARLGGMGERRSFIGFIILEEYNGRLTDGVKVYRALSSVSRAFMEEGTELVRRGVREGEMDLRDT